MNGQLTEQFTVQRGVRQGSPMLFLIVMDSLLVELANANCGVSVQQIYTGSFGQADDLRCVAPNLLSVEQQAFIVNGKVRAIGVWLSQTNPISRISSNCQ